MRQVPFRLIDLLSAQLLQATRDPARVEHLISAGIRQRVIDKDTLPLLVQKTVKGTGAWCLALRVLQSRHLAAHHIRVDESIWSMVESAVPENDVSKEAARTALKQIYKAQRPKRYSRPGID